MPPSHKPRKKSFLKEEILNGTDRATTCLVELIDVPADRDEMKKALAEFEALEKGVMDAEAEAKANSTAAAAPMDEARNKQDEARAERTAANERSEALCMRMAELEKPEAELEELKDEATVVLCTLQHLLDHELSPRIKGMRDVVSG